MKKIGYSVKTTPTFDETNKRKPEKFDATTILRWLHKQIEGTKILDIQVSHLWGTTQVNGDTE